MNSHGREHASRLLLTTPRFRVEGVRHTTPDGDVRTREVIRHPGAVVILPLVDPEHVCLIQNFRIAVGQRLIELPAGTLEPPEVPLATARRELAEETGYRTDQFRLLHTFYPSPGILDERMFLYLATELTPGSAARQPGEAIDNLVVPWQTALAMVDDRTIQDAKTIIGLLFYERIRNRKRAIGVEGE